MQSRTDKILLPPKFGAVAGYLAALCFVLLLMFLCLNRMRMVGDTQLYRQAENILLWLGAGFGLSGSISIASWNYTLATEVANMDAAALIAILLRQENIWLAASRTSEPALNELVRRMRVIKPNEYDLLPAASREYLYTLLKSKDPEIVSPLLLAFQRLEDHRALPHVTRLASGDWTTAQYKEVRNLASICLQVLHFCQPNMDSNNALIADLSNESNRHRRITNILLILFFVSSVLCCGLIFWALQGNGTSLMLSNPLITSYQIAGLSSISIFFFLVVFHSQRSKGKSYQQLSRFILFKQQPLSHSDLQLLAPLVDAIPFGCLNTSTNTYQEALIELLNVITPEDRGVLNENQQSILWSAAFLGWSSMRCSKRELAVAVIQAMSFIGGEEMVFQIQRIADSEEYSENHTCVIAAAQKYLPLMKTRMHDQKLPATLLRPSAQNTPPEMLLRPTNRTEQGFAEDAMQLLRTNCKRDQT